MTVRFTDHIETECETRMLLLLGQDYVYEKYFLVLKLFISLSAFYAALTLITFGENLYMYTMTCQKSWDRRLLP